MWNMHSLWCWIKNKTIEVRDRLHWYLIHIFNFLQIGSILPLELAKESLRNLLIEPLMDELYSNGIQQKKIIYHEPLGANKSRNFPK